MIISFEIKKTSTRFNPWSVEKLIFQCSISLFGSFSHFSQAGIILCFIHINLSHSLCFMDFSLAIYLSRCGSVTKQNWYLANLVIQLFNVLNVKKWDLAILGGAVYVHLGNVFYIRMYGHNILTQACRRPSKQTEVGSAGHFLFSQNMQEMLEC